jgi:hypothetical protein
MSEQNNQGFRGIPGVPDGWELVAIRVPKEGEWFVGVDGKPFQADHACGQQWTIIRKIEKPKQYRPFANGAEFEPHRDRWVKIVSEDNNSGCDLDGRTGDKQKVVCHHDRSVCLWGGWLNYSEAFECFVFDDDGTPFGVEVTQ